MAANEPTWSKGKSRLFTSSGATVGDGDDKWSGGRNVLFHDYVVATGYGAILKRWNGSAWEKAKLMRYNGSSWEAAALNVRGASSWLPVDTTGV